MKEQGDNSDLNHVPRNHDSINNFINYSLNKNEAIKEQELAMSQWKGSNKLKGAIFYFIGGLYLLIAGIVFEVKNNDITEIRVDYYSLPDCSNYGTKCCFTFNVPNLMSGPVYLFVEMKNYNQNTDTYFKKYDASQLYSNINGEDTGDCNPFTTNQDILGNKPYIGFKSIDGKTDLNPSNIAYPCGIRAYDVFQEKFSDIRHQTSGQSYELSYTGISWQYDVDNMKNQQPSQQWLDLEFEPYQIWMRPSGLSKFRKTLGKIQSDLQSGTYNICTTNTYNLSIYDSQKALILSNVNSTGGKNLMLVVSHLVGGSVAILGSVGLLLWHYKKRLPQ
ncbi:ligand-effect modulator 3 LEM3 family protein (macronuclear) [Tetrahymena thermophila SB210]|uniref:Ligand-effect modulator 3 LEM3 family protein n=1 Tax=Tetrahymena thermophila (strain SB210) TaxID=312017 RepID=Q23K24_TETTS|nr:ligand-effect modulator 3 LEM3 family protein [Tetrahymena thermophila SB210]EAR97019.2 ligand-effect modulator 3 LEM3 family protein [Tetrahymena thermophila SB210]|eukprot:XP_001017264.2 ligand-effect modulator 3 LEM3 family protein [Tetrahymena thermophila SB210]